MSKPFLKWVGGKTQIIDTVVEKFPSSMDNYYEPFLGGGSVLITFLNLVKEGKIIVKENVYASDANGSLINVYQSIQRDSKGLYEHLKKLYDEYSSMTVMKDDKKKRKTIISKEAYYYQQREKFNNSKEKAALFIFLNKTGFRGLYRESKNGFNVPFGNYDNVTCITLEELTNLQELFKSDIFEKKDFREALKSVSDEDFVYLDPPYYPENEKSFTKYNKGDFTLQDHKDLFVLCKGLKRFVLSNACVDEVLEEFEDYKVEKVDVKRAINSRNPGAKTREVLVCG
jgi:DNA adenine methylase